MLEKEPMGAKILSVDHRETPTGPPNTDLELCGAQRKPTEPCMWNALLLITPWQALFQGLLLMNSFNTHKNYISKIRTIITPFFFFFQMSKQA